MICHFCRQIDVGNDPGVICCPVWQTEFKIDDQGESAFVNVEEPRLPIKGVVCLECGVVQGARRVSCGYCETIVNKTAHRK